MSIVKHPVSRPRLLFVDGLRGIAAMSVVVCHFYGHLRSALDQWLHESVQVLMSHGFEGVTIFFVLSGLVITKTDDSFESALVRSDEAALLGVKEPLPVLLVRGVAYTASGLAVRSTKSIYRGDLFRFQINPQSGLMMRIEQPILA